MDSTSAAELNAELSSVCTVTVRLVRLLKPSTTDKQRDIAIFTDIFIAAGINDVGRSSRGRNGLSCGKSACWSSSMIPLRRYG